ncbi:MAG: hypothetical protein ACXV7J_10280 [Methylomonas sp.]
MEIINTSSDEECAQLTQNPAGAVSWSAILAGAAAIASLSLILVLLGSGLGLSAVSPWANEGVSATTFGISSILWLTLTQFFASGFGGYLTGRLRIKWVAVHTDEVYFRDTAHGFLAWAIAVLLSAACLTSTIGSIVSSGVQAGASAAGGAATATAAAIAPEMTKPDGDNGPTGYFVDSLFRPGLDSAASPAPDESSAQPDVLSKPDTAESSREITLIFMNAIRTNGSLPAEDIHYLGQVVSQRTGLTQQDAEKRVVDTYTKWQAKLRDAETAAKEAADKSRKASAYVALWLFISLLIGAFIASYATIFGGRQRDM